jgi:hypothetical protein
LAGATLQLLQDSFVSCRKLFLKKVYVPAKQTQVSGSRIGIMELGECDILKPSLQRVVTLIVVDEGFELPAGTITT